MLMSKLYISSLFISNLTANVHQNIGRSPWLWVVRLSTDPENIGPFLFWGLGQNKAFDYHGLMMKIIGSIINTVNKQYLRLLFWSLSPTVIAKSGRLELLQSFNTDDNNCSQRNDNKTVHVCMCVYVCALGRWQKGGVCLLICVSSRQVTCTLLQVSQLLLPADLSSYVLAYVGVCVCASDSIPASSLCVCVCLSMCVCVCVCVCV